MKRFLVTQVVAVCAMLLLTVAAEARCYDAKVLRVYDGDTFWADVDLGFGMAWNDKPVRILGIEAPEIWPLATRTEATRVRDILAARIDGQKVKICTKDHPSELDSFGRVLAYVYSNGVDVGQWLLDADLVAVYEE